MQMSSKFPLFFCLLKKKKIRVLNQKPAFTEPRLPLPGWAR